MTVTVNGEVHDVEPGSTLGLLIAQLGVRRDGIAVARNDDVVPSGSIESTLLTQGDTIEIIVAVAGG
jgi:thiamine biosynthesis protein ThiS